MCSKVLKTCSNVFKTCSNVFQICSIVFKCVQMCLNMLKICSNVLILAGLSGYGWVYGGNGCFLVVMVIMSAYGVNTFVFWGFM